MNERSFAERHADTIAKLIVALIVLCVIAIPVTFWVNHQDVGSVNKRVTRIESPCLRYGPKSLQCKRSFEQAVLTITHAEACAILRKAGLKIMDCKGARLAQEKGRNEERAANGGGDASQPPSHGGQQPGPPGGGHPGGNGGGNPTPETAPEVRASDNTPPVPAVVEHVEEVVGQTPAGPVLETVNGTACHLVASC